MIGKNFLLAGVAALALAGCSGKDGKASAPQTAASAKAVDVKAQSPIELKYKQKGAKALDVDAFFALMDDAQATYDDASFDEKLGATVVTNLRLADANDSDGLTVERAEFYGVDLDAIGRVADKSAAAIDAPFENVFSKVRLYGVTPIDSDDDAPDVKIGALELDALRIRRGGVNEDSEINEGAQFFNAIELGGLYLKDISVSGGDAQAGPKINLSAPDIRFVGIGGGRLGAIIANELSYEFSQTPESVKAIGDAMGPPGAMLLNGPLKNFIAPENQRVTLQSFEWKNIDFSGLLEYGVKGEKPPMSATNLINLGTIKATNAETYIGDKLLSSVAEADIPVMEFTWLIPSKIRAVTKGGKYDFTAYTPASEEQAIAVLKKHGLDNVDASSSVAWDWDPKKGAADLVTDFKSAGFADFDLSFSLGGLELEKINAAMEAGDEDAVAKFGTFKNFSVTLKDEKLLDTIFDFAALQMGAGTGEDLRTSAPAMVRLSGAQFAQMNPRFSGYIDAVAEFLASGGTLTIEAAPEKPVPLSAIDAAGKAGPQTLPDIVNLNVTHKK